MKRRDIIKRRIRMMHGNIERMRGHLYEVWQLLDEDMKEEETEIAMFTKLLEEVDEAVDKLRADIIG